MWPRALLRGFGGPSSRRHGLTAIHFKPLLYYPLDYRFYLSPCETAACQNVSHEGFLLYQCVHDDGPHATREFPHHLKRQHSGPCTGAPQKPNLANLFGKFPWEGLLCFEELLTHTKQTMRQTYLDIHIDAASVFTVDPARLRWDGYPMRLTDHLMETLAERSWGSDASGGLLARPEPTSQKRQHCLRGTGQWVWNGEAPSTTPLDEEEVAPPLSTPWLDVSDGDVALSRRSRTRLT